MRRLSWACLSSDDVVVPAALSALGRLLWVAVVAAILYAYRDAAATEPECAKPVTAFLSVSIAVHAVGFALDVLITCFSSTGSLKLEGRRKFVSPLLVLRGIEATADIIIASFGVTSSSLLEAATTPVPGAAGGGLACLSSAAAAGGAPPPGILIDGSSMEAAALRRALLAASVVGLILSGSFLCCFACCAAVCRRSRRAGRSGGGSGQQSEAPPSSCSHTLTRVLRCLCRGAASPTDGQDAASPLFRGFAVWGAAASDESAGDLAPVGSGSVAGGAVPPAPTALKPDEGLSAASYPLLNASDSSRTYNGATVGSGSKATVLRAFAATLSESMEPLFAAGLAFSDVAAGLKLVRARQTAELEAAAAADPGALAAVSYSGGPQTPLRGSASAGGPPLTASLPPLPPVTGKEAPFQRHMPEASWWLFALTPRLGCSCIRRRIALGTYRLRAYWHNVLVSRLGAAAAAEAGSTAAATKAAVKVPRFAVRDLCNSVPLASPALAAAGVAEASGAALEDATHFGWYALSAYGWPLYLLDNLSLGVCKLTAVRAVTATRAALRLLAALATGRCKRAAAVVGACNGADPCCLNPTARTIWLTSAAAVAGASPRAPEPGVVAAGAGTLAALYTKTAPSSSSSSPAVPPTPSTDPGVVAQGSVPVAIRAPESATATGPPSTPALAATALHARSTLHASYKNRIFECPYFVAWDARSGAWVVSVRGTMSLEDAVTDVVAKPVPLGATPADTAAFVAAAGLDLSAELGPSPSPAELDEHLRVHAGMWLASQLLVSRLQDLGVVPREATPTTTNPSIGAGKDAATLLVTRGEEGVATLELGREAQPAPAAATSQVAPIVVVGHSLGAGVASLTSLLLRPLCPTVRCFAYAPPAALVSPVLSRAMVSWTTSVIRGHDIVPRLSLPALRTLLVDAVQHVETCNSHKATVLGWNPVRAWQLRKTKSAAERYIRLMAGTVGKQSAVGSGDAGGAVTVVSPLAKAASSATWAQSSPPSKFILAPSPRPALVDCEAGGAAFADVALTSPTATGAATGATEQSGPTASGVTTPTTTTSSAAGAGIDGEPTLGAEGPASAATVAAAVAASVSDAHSFHMQVPGRVMLLVRAGAAPWGGFLPALLASLFGWWAPGFVIAVTRFLGSIPSPLSTLLLLGLCRRRRSLHIPVWAPYSALSSINISWTMFSHHLPHTLLDALSLATSDARVRAAVATQSGEAWQ